MPTPPVASGKTLASPHRCAGGVSAGYVAHLPTVEVRVEGRAVRALVDNGCSVSMIEQRLVPENHAERVSEKLQTVLGPTVIKFGAWLDVSVSGRQMRCWVLLARNLSGIGADMLLGMDMISMLGGVHVWKSGAEPTFGPGRSTGSNQKPGLGEIDRNDQTVAVLSSPVGVVTVDSKQERAARQGAKIQISDTDFTTDFDGQFCMVRWHWEE